MRRHGGMVAAELRAVVLGLLVVGIAAGVAGCGPIAAEGRATPTRPAPAPPPTQVAGADEVDKLIRLAKQDVARRTGIAEEEIEVVSVSSETWRDTSLGCPEPGKAYAQVLTPGHRIVLQAGGKSYEYHTDSSRVVLCQGLS